MADVTPLNGFNGKVTIEIVAVETTIAGLSGFTIGEDARNVLDVPTTFDTDRNQVLIQQKSAITFNATGYTLPEDGGQDAIRDLYESQDEETTIKFWLDETHYVQPVSGDHVLISSIGEVSTDAEGFASFEFSGYFFNDYEIITDPSA